MGLGDRVATAYPTAGARPNTLTAGEAAEGWRLLFDGRTTAGWHGYGKRSADGWVIEDGTLRGSPGSGGRPSRLEDGQHTGSNYALHPAPIRAARPIGEWNSSRLVVDGSHVEHWLNGVKVLEYEMGSDDWQRRLAPSRYGERPEYGRAARGRLALQDHGGKARFRSVKIRPR